MNGLYEASTDGHIRNSKTKRVLHEFPGKDGYLRSQFGGKTRLIHRVIADAYHSNWVAEEVWTLIFLLIVALIVLVVSSFMMGYNMPESDWWKAMYTTLDDCDRDMDSNHHTADWYYGVIWAHRSIIENKKGETHD